MRRQLAIPVAVALVMPACAHVPPATLATTGGMTCKSGEMLVVDNHSGYTVRLVAGEPGGGVNAPPNSSILVRAVPSGAVDTIRSVAGANRALFFDVDRPALPSGAIQKTSGYSGRCVPRT